MAKRAARRSARRPSTRTARPSGSPGAEWSRRWWARVTKTVLTLGALAGAITATLALLPSPDPEDSARFTAVHIISLVPLSEYRQRSSAMVPQGSRRKEGLQRDHEGGEPVAELALAAAGRSSSPVKLLAALSRLQADPTDSSASEPATDTSAPEPPSSDDPASSDTATSDTASSDTATWDTATSDDPASSDTATSETTTSAPPTTEPPTTAATSDAGGSSPSVSFVVPQAFQQGEFTTYSQQVLEDVEAEDSSVASCKEHPTDCGLVVVIASASTDQDGNPVSPDVAAERVLKVLREVRRTEGGQAPGSKPRSHQSGGNKPTGEPLGVVVSADLELIGLRGKPVLLTWSMWQQGGKKRLYGNWLNRNLAYRLEATTDHDTTTLDLWIPLPKLPGRYFIRVNLAADQSPLASADSPSFE
jgi:hypothetical protein